jgi:hypothetical protein
MMKESKRFLPVQSVIVVPSAARTGLLSVGSAALLVVVVVVVVDLRVVVVVFR